MRWYWRLLIALAAALAGALAWRWLSADPGYVLVTFAGWSVQTSLLFAAFLLIVLLAVLRLAFRMLRAPFKGWQRHRRKVARARLARGLVALREGRWSGAEKLLRRAASDRAQRPAAYLAAAQAARALGAEERAESYLDEAARAGSDDAVLAARAERLLSVGDAERAQTLLGKAARSRNLGPDSMHRYVQALRESGRAVEATALLAKLRASRLLTAEAFHACETQTWQAALVQAETFEALNEVWHRLSRSQRAVPALAGAFACKSREFDEHAAGAAALEFALDRHWDERLALGYGTLIHARGAAAIKRCERWLEDHPDSAALRLSLGQLCRREQLWGKAEQYLQAALPALPRETWEALADLAADRGDASRAEQALRNALRVERGQATQALRALPPPSGERAEREERDDMGLPRLPGATSSERPFPV